MNKARVITVFLLCIFILFFYGVIRLFEIRFESGDVYPQYSSLRSDPLGTKALYESLENIQGMSVSRNYKPLSQSDVHDQNATVFFLGMSGNSLAYVDEKEVEHLESLMNKGWQAVILFNPKHEMNEEPVDCDDKDIPPVSKESAEEPSEGIHDAEREDAAEAGVTEASQRISLFKRWGFDLRSGDIHEHDEGSHHEPARRATDSYSLPDSLFWNGSLHFQQLTKEWNHVYSREGKAVMIERPFGTGKAVLATDTYLASNEAMWKDRHADLIVWLAGRNRNIIFDETHLGIHDKQGIVSLARRYRLHGLMAGVLLLTLLFIWKNSTSLVPPVTHASDNAGHPAAGKDSMAGFTNLLKRNIAHHELLHHCFQEWGKANRYRKKLLRDESKKIQDIIEREKALPSQQKQPLKAYQAIVNILSERNIK